MGNLQKLASCARADEGCDQEWSPHDKDEFVLQLTQVSLLLRLQFLGLLTLLGMKSLASIQYFAF